MSNERKFRRKIEAESLFEREMTLSELMKLVDSSSYGGSGGRVRPYGHYG